jgi:ParB/RepB/Spo0J family partition protein
MVATQEAKNKKTAASEVKEGEKIILIHVDDIHADLAWNARSGEWWLDGLKEAKPENGEAPPEEPKKGKKPKAPKTDDRTRFGDLKDSILETGTNEQPILVRQAARKDGKLRLVCGFMRHRAVTEIMKEAELAKGAIKENEKLDSQKGLIRAVFRHMNDQEARMANIRENTARDDLKGPDLCWSVGEAMKQYGFSDTTLAASLGKSQGYISKLHRIYKVISPKVLQQWRDAPVQVTIEKIMRDVIMITNDKSDAVPSHEEQEDYFKRVLEGTMEPSKGRGPDG